MSPTDDVALAVGELGALGAAARLDALALWESRARSWEWSVAELSRVSLGLLALGGTAALVSAAHEAALARIDHLEAAQAIVGALRGVPVAPQPLDLDALGDPAASFEALCREALGTLREQSAAERDDLRREAQRAPEALSRVLLAVADAAEGRRRFGEAIVRWAVVEASADERAGLVALVREARAPELARECEELARRELS